MLKDAALNTRSFSFALFLAAFLLYFFFINKGPYHPDTLQMILRAEQTLEAGQLQPYYSGYNVSIVISSFFIWVARLCGISDPVLPVNFSSVVFGALAVLAFYLLCRKIIDRLGALMAAMMLLTLPLFFSLSTVGTSQIPAIFFLFLGFKFLFDHKEGRRGALTWAAIAFALLWGSRPQELVCMLPAAVCFFVPFRKKWKDLLYFLAWILLIALAVIFLFCFRQGVFRVDILEELYRVYPSTGKTTGRAVLGGFLFGGATILKELMWPLIIAGSYGFYLLMKERKRDVLFLLLWIMSSFSLYAFAAHKTNPAERYFLLVLPPFLAAAGYLFSSWINGKILFFRVGGVALFIGIQLTMLMSIMPVLHCRHENAVAVNFAEWIAAHTETSAVIIGRDERLFLKVYAKREWMDMPLSAKDGRMDDFELELKEKILQKIPVYIIVVFPEDREILNSLAERYCILHVGNSLFEYWQRSATELQVCRNMIYKVSSL